MTNTLILVKDSHFFITEKPYVQSACVIQNHMVLATFQKYIPSFLMKL